jgi:type VI secretion system protein ImpG
MRDELLLYYERELTYLRQMAAEFAQKYPKVASRLVLEPDKCEDPHVERLLEGFAFLAARVHLKVDDEFPQVTQSLLNIVYPHFLRPIPSMSIVEFGVDLDQGKLTSSLNIDRGSALYSRPVNGIPCKFRTCYDTTLWPVQVSAAEWRAPSQLDPPVAASDSVVAIRLRLDCGPDVAFQDLNIDRLRFYLNGDSNVVYKLYELLCSRLNRIVVRDTRPNSDVRPITLPKTSLRPVGFAEDEALLPYARRSFVGYRLLQEYFAFPEKFLFIDVEGLQEIWGAGFDTSAEIIFLISSYEGTERDEMLETAVTPKTFRLGCAPVINLFEQTAEPVLLGQRKYEYPVIPDIRRPTGTEVFSIDEVLSINVNTQSVTNFRPFYSLQHTEGNSKGKAFWTAERRQSTRPEDQGTDMFVSLVDLSMKPVHPDQDTLTIRTTCTNRDLPARLPFGNEDEGDFQLESSGPVKKIVAVRKPTAPLRPPTGRAMQWHLISQLSLNYLSIVSEGTEALQRILRLYDVTNSSSTQKMIEGIASISSRRHFARLLSEHGITFARGTRVELELDEKRFVGGGVYLFASVIEQFLAHYVSLNSFSQLVARTKQRKEVVRIWPPKTGRQILL